MLLALALLATAAPPSCISAATRPPGEAGLSAWHRSALSQVAGPAWRDLTVRSDLREGWIALWADRTSAPLSVPEPLHATLEIRRSTNETARVKQCLMFEVDDAVRRLTLKTPARWAVSVRWGDLPIWEASRTTELAVYWQATGGLSFGRPAAGDVPVAGLASLDGWQLALVDKLDDVDDPGPVVDLLASLPAVHPAVEAELHARREGAAPSVQAAIDRLQDLPVSGMTTLYLPEGTTLRRDGEELAGSANNGRVRYTLDGAGVARLDLGFPDQHRTMLVPLAPDAVVNGPRALPGPACLQVPAAGWAACDEPASLTPFAPGCDGSWPVSGGAETVTVAATVPGLYRLVAGESVTLEVDPTWGGRTTVPPTCDPIRAPGETRHDTLARLSGERSARVTALEVERQQMDAELAELRSLNRRAVRSADRYRARAERDEAERWLEASREAAFVVFGGLATARVCAGQSGKGLAACTERVKIALNAGVRQAHTACTAKGGSLPLVRGKVEDPVAALPRKWLVARCDR